MNCANETGIVFDIQRYSIHDGPGIRTIVFLKGCPLRCPWCANPESQKKEPELWYAKSKCIGCGKCVDACAQKAITKNEGDGILIDHSLCINCGVCAEGCCAKALEIVGTRMSVSQILELVEKDRSFYMKSGGGVTLSGGEPFSQPGFALEILRACKIAGIHTAVETTGYARWEDIKLLLPYIDLLLWDIKIFDSKKHKQVIGTSNILILKNAQKASRLGASLMIRVAVIPGVNDDQKNLLAITAFAEKIGAKGVNLLPYHRLGESKYEKLCKTYTLSSILPPKEERMLAIMKLLEGAGVPITVGG